jgi:hypothetical protein
MKMTDEYRIGPEGRDDDVTRALRRMYAAPEGEAYWSELEHRVLARVAGAPAGDGADSWWLSLSRWATPGLIAAALAMMVAGATLWRARETRERTELEALLLHENPPLAQLSAVAGSKPDNEAVLRYVLTP